ncbi:MAG: phage tail tape measure protein [Staphylococcus equorum]|nr:phage tail tape measure protein [Staphylococcus equorum]
MWKVGKDFQETGKKLTKTLTIPLVGAGIAAAKIGIDFEKTMSGVEAVTGAAGKELDDLELKAREMGKSTTKSSSQAAEAMEYMGLAGWETTQIIEGIEPVLRLSEAGNLDLARASDLVTDSMSAMGIEVQDLDRYLDVVAQTARSSNTDIDAMMEAYLGVGGVLRGLDADLEDSAVALGMLANAGIRGSESGKSLSAILTNLTAPTGRAKKALDELGFSAFDAEGNFKGIDEVLFELKDTMKDMTPEQKNMYKSMIAGKEHTKGLNALLNGLDDSYEELSESIGNSEGALMSMAEIMNDNTAGSISRLLSAMQETALTIYDKMRPAIVSVIEKLKGFADIINDLTPGQEDMIANILKFALVIGPATLGVGKLNTGISSLIFKFSDTAREINRAGGVIGWLKSPLMIARIASVALIAAGILLYKNWDTVKEKALELKERFSELKEMMVENEAAIKNTAGVITALFIPALIKTGVQSVIAGTKMSISFVGSLIKAGAQAVITGGQITANLIGSLIRYAAQGWITVASITATTASWIAQKVAMIASATASGILTAAQWALNAALAANPITIVIGLLVAFGAAMVIAYQKSETFREVVTKAWNGIQSAATTVTGIVMDGWNSVVGVFNTVSTKVESMAGTIKDSWQSVRDFMSNPIKGTVNAVKKGAGWVKDKIGNNYQGTDNWRGGPTWVNEKGPEIIDLPSGSRVYPHSKSLDMARKEGRSENKGSNSPVINFNIDGMTIREEADIDKFASAFVSKLTETSTNMA